MAGPTGVADQLVSPRVRCFVLTFLAIFLLAGFLSVDAWPFTSWHLFSQVRGSIREGWVLNTVDREGAETPLSLGDLPVAYRNTYHLIADFDEITAAERDAVCRAWAGGAERLGREVVEVRVYRARYDVRTGRRLDDDVRYVCGEQR